MNAVPARRVERHLDAVAAERVERMARVPRTLAEVATHRDVSTWTRQFARRLQDVGIRGPIHDRPAKLAHIGPESPVVNRLREFGAGDKVLQVAAQERDMTRAERVDVLIGWAAGIGFVVLLAWQAIAKAVG